MKSSRSKLQPGFNRRAAAAQQSFAAALQYDVEAQGVPTLAASGSNELARELLATARRYGVPIVHRPQLAEELQSLQVDQEIPPELYDQVAELLLGLGCTPQTSSLKRKSRP